MQHGLSKPAAGLEPGTPSLRGAAWSQAMSAWLRRVWSSAVESGKNCRVGDIPRDTPHTVWRLCATPHGHRDRACDQDGDFGGELAPHTAHRVRWDLTRAAAGSASPR